MKPLMALAVLALSAVVLSPARAQTTNAPPTYSFPPNELSVLPQSATTNEAPPTPFQKDWRHPAPMGASFLTGGVARIELPSGISTLIIDFKR